MKHIDYSRTLMLEFAYSTGLTNTSIKPNRYLWTDAFAVCNFLGLYQYSNEKYFLELALQLVEQVHNILGRHRLDSNNKGWISGLSDEEALLHPTKGGLRIGKKLNERQIGEPVDKILEWEQDGQYFHYLTKWMHALNRVSQVTGKSIYNRWAIELAKKTYLAFTYTNFDDKLKYIYWKMNIDLSRPLVDSMGYHDPLDGYLTYLHLESTAKTFGIKGVDLDLTREIEVFSGICKGRQWGTTDALGIGGLLTDTYRLVQLSNDNSIKLELLLNDCLISLEAYYKQNQLNQPAQYRLAFREFGLSIGLHSLPKIQKIIKNLSNNFDNVKQINFLINKISHYQFMIPLVENFWLELKHQSSEIWINHIDINKVMLATSLVSEGYLGFIDKFDDKI